MLNVFAKCVIKVTGLQCHLPEVQRLELAGYRLTHQPAGSGILRRSDPPLFFGLHPFGQELRRASFFCNEARAS